MNSSDFSNRVRQCVEHLVQSREAALAGLFDLASSRLVRFATSITRHQHDAEDAVQTVLVRVSLDPKRIASTDNPWPYLLRMTRNEALVILRKRRRWSLMTTLSELLTQPSSNEAAHDAIHRNVWLALSKLPAEQREVVVLKIWEDLTFHQISGILDISPATAASRYRYAMQKLANKLRGVMEDAK